MGGGGGDGNVKSWDGCRWGGASCGNLYDGNMWGGESGRVGCIRSRV